MTARASRTKDKKKGGDRDTERKAAQSGRGKSRPKEELRKESGNQSANGLNELRLVQSMSEKDTDELSDTGKEQISLNGSSAMRYTGIKREGILEDVNGSLNGDSGKSQGRFSVSVLSVHAMSQAFLVVATGLEPVTPLM